METVREYDWRCNVIRDGLDMPGYISEVEGLHTELRFRYRPMLPEHVDKFEFEREQLGVKDPEAARARIGKKIAVQVTQWSELDEKNNPLPITEMNCRKLRTTLQFKLWNIIAGYAPTSIDPKGGYTGGLQPVEDLERISETVGN